MSPLRLAQVAVAAAAGMGANAEAQAFLSGERRALEARLTPAAARGPCLLLGAHLGQLCLEAGDLDGARDLLQAGQAAFQELDLPEPSVAAELYWLAAQVHKHRRAFGEFFRAALLYLCYVPVDSLAPAARLSLAVDVSLAALLAPEVHSFGELLTHPIVGALAEDGLGYGWLLQLLRAVGGGDLAGFRAVLEEHASEVGLQPALLEARGMLERKAGTAAIVRHVVKAHAEGSKERLALAEVAGKTGLSEKAVHELLAQAFAGKLLKGTIDQVAGTLQVTWVKPRVLTFEEIAECRGKLGIWGGKAAECLSSISQYSSLVLEA